jgi:hypothetical protein
MAKPSRFGTASPTLADVPENTIPLAKQSRPRRWEKSNRAYSYRIPVVLNELAAQLRQDVMSIAQFDEHGQPRQHQTSVDLIAAILMDWALQTVQKTPDLIRAAPNPQGRGLMTGYAAAWDAWQKPEPLVSLPRSQHRKKREKASLFLAYRWRAETDQAIRQLANDRYIASGEAVVRLLEIAVNGYKQREFRIKLEIQGAVLPSGWERWE